MKFPPTHSRARTILTALRNNPSTIHQGIERHSLLGVGEKKIRDIYDQLELNGWIIKTGVVYSVSEKARLRFAPAKNEDDGAPTEPAYRGNWMAPAMTAGSARRSGAAFGLNWIRQ